MFQLVKGCYILYVKTFLAYGNVTFVSQRQADALMQPEEGAELDFFAMGTPGYDLRKKYQYNIKGGIQGIKNKVCHN